MESSEDAAVGDHENHPESFVFATEKAQTVGASYRAEGLAPKESSPTQDAYCESEGKKKEELETGMEEEAGDYSAAVGKDSAAGGEAPSEGRNSKEDETNDNANLNATDSTVYEYSTNKGKEVFDLTVVNGDGSEIYSPVAKQAGTSEDTEEEGEGNKESAENETNQDEGEETGGNRKKKRLYFGRDKLIFVHMAQAYIKHELYKFDTPDRWEAAYDEFYNQRSMDEVVVKKGVLEVKKPFLSGLESRIKALPKKIQQHETDEQKLCREIKRLKEEVQEERIRKGEEDPENRKKRKRAGPETRGRPRTSDIEMTPQMEQQFYAAQQVRDEEKKAADAVKDIERQIRELQKRLEVAKQEQQAAAERADKVSTEFSAEVIHGTGPWKDMFVQLQQYGKEHGTVNIIRGQSAEMKALRRWVLRQRERYHMNDDQKGKLPWYCAKNLEAIGFLWRYSDGTWMKFYEELLEYKKEHGDCAVPRGYKANPKLSQWVKRMRHEGNRFRENPNSVSMTAHQHQMLLDIGFIWENLSRSWNERFEDLKRFKAEHGHCRVPKNYPANPKLVSWCQNQRAHHRAFILGKKTFMDAARKKQLEEVGFEWETGAAPGRPPSAPDKKKRARKKKGDARDESDSEEEDVEMVNNMQNGLGHEQEPTPQFVAAPAFAPVPQFAPQVAAAQAFQNHPFAHPNHAYANPYQQQQHHQQHLQQQRHFYPTL